MVWTMVFLVPFLLILFFATICIKKERVHKWREYFFASTIILTSFDTFLFVGACVMHAITTGANGC